MPVERGRWVPALALCPGGAPGPALLRPHTGCWGWKPAGTATSLRDSHRLRHLCPPLPGSGSPAHGGWCPCSPHAGTLCHGWGLPPAWARGFSPTWGPDVASPALAPVQEPVQSSHHCWGVVLPRSPRHSATGSGTAGQHRAWHIPALASLEPT